MTQLRLGRLDVQLAGNKVVMAGRIDDGCALGELVEHVAPGDVVIDTAGVVFINSIGMREWTRLVRVLRERGRVVLERVADVMMTQMNLFSELASSVTVTSFHAQYVCPACGGEHVPLVDAVIYSALLATLEAPRLPCPECGAQMELGDFPERYLSLFRSS
jgi:predicted RNA-binding Zn-ribbon protein involved in translation (DUF1610 family)